MSQAQMVPRRRAGATRPTPAEQKLGLLEFLVASEDLVEVATRSLEWLAEFCGLKAGMCLALDPDLNRLTSVAVVGVKGADITRFSLDVADRSHPLVAATFAGGSVAFPNDGGDPRVASTPLGSIPYAAVPMYGRLGRQEWTAGLLLVAPPDHDLLESTKWLSEVLGHRLVRLTRIQQMGETERRLRRERVLLDSVPDPILLTDTEGRMLVANARAKTLLASGEEESEGRRRAVAINNMLLSAALAQGALREAGRGREMLLVDPADGSDLLFELLSTVASDPREGTAVVSIMRNVSDLRRAMEEIEENYRRLRVAEADVRAERDRLDLIIDSVADPILVTDSSGQLILMNAPAERLFVVPRDGAPEQALRVRANDAHFSSFISNVFFQGTRVRGEIGLVEPSTGAPFPVEAVAGKVVSEHGEVVTVVTVLHDRTEEMERARLYEELKKASELLEQRIAEATAELVSQNERLRRQQLELEQASAAKSQFLANMSHEFRTPLNAIMGYTSLLLQGVSGSLNALQEKNLSRVDSNARHLMALINDILDISRIEAGRMPVTLEIVDVPRLVTEVLAELDPIIVRSQLAVRAETGRSVPAVETDRAKVKQIVVNLVSNAIKFTPSGSVTIRTAYEAASRSVTVAVTDTGIGIAAAEQEKIFEDFRQADSSMARRFPGAGLGLSISRRLATMLDGRIELRSQPGQGSTFTLVLPRSQGGR